VELKGSCGPKRVRVAPKKWDGPKPRNKNWGRKKRDIGGSKKGKGRETDAKNNEKIVQ